jgi:hypothetical protein
MNKMFNLKMIKMEIMEEKWGYLRETQEKAIEEGTNPDNGLHRTGLDEYLKVIFHSTCDWEHDEEIPKEIQKDRGAQKTRKYRPDYRNEKENLIIEYDGLPHFQYIGTIKKDIETTDFYKQLGYKVVRIPYFIQLTNKAVYTLFGKEVPEKLFNESYPSLGINWNNAPAIILPEGVRKMAKAFLKFPEQYKVNVEFLKSQNDPLMSGVEFLENEYNKLNG